jgi:hypothetical protein
MSVRVPGIEDHLDELSRHTQEIDPMNRPSYQLLIARDLRTADNRWATEDRRALAAQVETTVARHTTARLRRISAVAVSLFG